MTFSPCIVCQGSPASTTALFAARSRRAASRHSPRRLPPLEDAALNLAEPVARLRERLEQLG